MPSKCSHSVYVIFDCVYVLCCNNCWDAFDVSLQTFWKGQIIAKERAVIISGVFGGWGGIKEKCLQWLEHFLSWLNHTNIPLWDPWGTARARNWIKGMLISLCSYFSPKHYFFHFPFLVLPMTQSHTLSCICGWRWDTTPPHTQISICGVSEITYFVGYQRSCGLCGRTEDWTLGPIKLFTS